MLIISTIVLIIAYIFIAFEILPKTTVALAGAAFLFFYEHASKEAVFARIDLNVIFLLVGMMIIVYVCSKSGMFNWCGIEMVRMTKGNPIMLLIAMGIFTAVTSAFIDNVTTIVIMLPIIYDVSKRMEISPIPYIISAVICSNIGGTATLIGDPPNIIIGSAAGLSFMDFAYELAPVVTIVLVATLAMLAFMFRKELVVKPENRAKLRTLQHGDEIKDVRRLIYSLAVLALVITGFVLHGALHMEVWGIAMAGATLLMLIDSPKACLEQVEWTSIFFFIGLFIIIGAFSEYGGIRILADWIINITGGNVATTGMLVLWASGFISAIVDNIPYTITMAPLVKALETAMPIHAIWWALSLGACLGGNMTIIGAAANVVASESARNRGHQMTFFYYLKYGFPCTIVALIICTGYLKLRFFM